MLDPHGNPIPAKNGSVAKPGRLTLSGLAMGQAARITRVGTDDPAFLRYLTDLGISLQTRVVVTDRAPFGGPLQVIIGEHTHALSEAVTDKLFVEVD